MDAHTHTHAHSQRVSDRVKSSLQHKALYNEKLSVQSTQYIILFEFHVPMTLQFDVMG